MAERRMFTKKITDSDAFVELSSAAQALYFHLNQGADDDGFNNQVQNAIFKAHASVDDLKILLLKNFIIRFDSGVIVIKHWRMHNTLRKDRYTPTSFQEELNKLGIKENGSYTLGCHLVAERLPQDSIGKDRLDKDNKEDVGDDKPVATTTKPEDKKVIITIFCNDGSEYEVTGEYFNQMQPLFPGVDLLAEFKKMKAWSINNPKKRKTKDGMKRFIGSWLSSAQNNATKMPSQPQATPQTQSEKVYRR